MTASVGGTSNSLIFVAEQLIKTLNPSCTVGNQISPFFSQDEHRDPHIWLHPADSLVKLPRLVVLLEFTNFLLLLRLLFFLSAKLLLCSTGVMVSFCARPRSLRLLHCPICSILPICCSLKITIEPAIPASIAAVIKVLRVVVKII